MTFIQGFTTANNISVSIPHEANQILIMNSGPAVVYIAYEEADLAISQRRFDLNPLAELPLILNHVSGIPNQLWFAGLGGAASTVSVWVI